MRVLKEIQSSELWIKRGGAEEAESAPEPFFRFTLSAEELINASVFSFPESLCNLLLVPQDESESGFGLDRLSSFLLLQYLLIFSLLTTDYNNFNNKAKR